MPLEALPLSARLKLDLMLDGVRYTEALGRAAEHSFPNILPYRFGAGETDPSGKGTVPIPYMLVTTNDTHARIWGNRASSWWVDGSRQAGYNLRHDRNGEAMAIDFEPAQRWLDGRTRDGSPRAHAGVTIHGDMAVINVAPGCEYFLAPQRDGVSMRCTFCTYGAPDSRIGRLGQVMGRTSIPEATYVRMQEVLSAGLDEGRIRHLYLVGGSLTDPREEGARFAELARRVQQVNRHRVPVTCGSGALPEACLHVLHGEQLVDAVCFNLEVWSERLFSHVCPGKQHFVGYHRWIESLEAAVDLWGRGRVYSAMVAGVELGQEPDVSLDEALEIALQGADELCTRGILPVYSLYWPPAPAGRHQRLREYFQSLQIGYHEIRRRHGLAIWDGLMCHRCAYMQLECDLDRHVDPVGPER